MGVGVNGTTSVPVGTGVLVGVGVLVAVGSVAMRVDVGIGVGVTEPVGVGVATMGAAMVAPKADALPSRSMATAERLVACQAPTMVKLKSPLA